MKKNSKMKFPKDPNISYFEKYRKDPEFQELYRSAYLRIGIAIEIARLRHEKRITQKKLAKLLKTDQAVISRIETGQENLSLESLRRIAEALGVAIEFKFNESYEKVQKSY